MQGRTHLEVRQLREELLERAKRGEISGEEADWEAVKAGLEPFAKRPEPAAFDPQREAYWTLPMAVAWIAYRTNDAVRESWDEYCAKCWHWIWRRWRTGPDGEVHEGWLLEQWLRPSLAKLSTGEAVDPIADDGKSTVMTVKESRETLWSALREGLFEATGVDTKTELRGAIPAIEWRELISVEAPDGIDEVRFGPLGHFYMDVLVPGEAVRRLWRAPREKVLSLPSLVPPEGPGHMPLYCAAQWIATEGGSLEFDPEDIDRWRAAFGQLLDRISSNDVRVSGVRENVREFIDAVVFAGCQIDYPYSDDAGGLGWGDAYYIQSYPYLDDEHWRRGFDDSFRNRDDVRWKQLMVTKGEVRAHWPFGTRDDSSGTGMAGRPALSKHFIEDELNRRAAAGRLLPKLTEEAGALVEWLKTTYPDQARPTAKTVENNIRSLYRSLKAPTKS